MNPKTFNIMFIAMILHWAVYHMAETYTPIAPLGLGIVSFVLAVHFYRENEAFSFVAGIMYSIIGSLNILHFFQKVAEWILH